MNLKKNDQMGISLLDLFSTAIATEFIRAADP